MSVPTETSEAIRELPNVSILWLNYNSVHVIDITKRSLKAIAQIDYPNFELIVIDNHSSDGSDKVIAQTIKETFPADHKVKFLRLRQNLGFAGGMNAGYNARYRPSEYVSLLHNDVIPKPDYLRRMVNYLESHRDVGAVQGIVVRLDNEVVVDSDGYLTDNSLAHTLHGKSLLTSEMIKAKYVTFVEGTMPVYRVNMVKRVLRSDTEIFVPQGFMHYLEDVFLSLMLWNSGYKSVVLPIITASHQRIAIIGKYGSKLSYFSARNRIALSLMVKKVDRPRVIMQTMRRIVISKATLRQRKVMLRALIDGLRLGTALKKRYGAISLSNVPLTPSSVRDRFQI